MILLTTARQHFAGFWNARAPRERNMIIAASLVVALALAYALLLDPALSGRKRLARELPTLRQQAAALQALTREAGTLAAKPSAPLPALTRENTEAALARHGLKPQSLSVTSGAVQLRLAQVPFSATLRWLDEIQRTMRLSVTEASLTVLAQPDTVDATLMLRQPQE